ncbi:hypothetical protein L3Q82_010819 [Scortum barcoo]|uniref:Uncharacterized protein n=1 Tax=Scortum barcoo TaxID=214431 RepID=A0ACB8W9D5_9TELE|nr:hypothetical protein L3Q82_010819 [Scortum barcoo]
MLGLTSSEGQQVPRISLLQAHSLGIKGKDLLVITTFIHCTDVREKKRWKELVVDFRRRSHSPPAPVSIQGTDIETVKSYKYLGVHLNDSLDWSDNTDALVKKGNSRLLFLLRRLRSFGVQGPLLRTFYDSVVASAIFYGPAASRTGTGGEWTDW